MDEEPEPNSPTGFQRRTLWTAITAVSLVVIATIAVGAIFIGGKVLGYLQPILVPIAIAGIIAYLLHPIITWLRRKTRKSHKTCMLVVFSGFIVLIILLAYAVVVPSFGQAKELIDDRETYRSQITELVQKGMKDLQERFNNPIAQKYYDRGIEWVSEEGPEVGQRIGTWVWERLMGAFGFVGYLLGLILVPVYLFFFLKESHTIKRTWSDYLPLRASRLKDEVVDTLQEINQYLISFFRGQMVVSLIDGALVAIALGFLGVPYALLIGVFLAILGLIPYIGNILVMIPAALIAISHFGAKSMVDLPFESTVEAGAVHAVQLHSDREEKKKYVSDVQWITVVTVDHDGSEVLAEVSSSSVTEQAALQVGQTATVQLPNGLFEANQIKAIERSYKRAEVLTNAWTFLPNPWWYPLIVIGIFVLLQQVNGLVTAPKIVGDSVGLHPLTVIFSVLFWSFLLGGLLGALLAVPMTASIKVLFRKYIWVKRIEPKVGPLREAAPEANDSEETGVSES